MHTSSDRATKKGNLMIHNMFAIHDSKAKAYLPPFVMPEKGQAIRVFSDCINSDDHQFSKHPADYTLMHIATFDDSIGIVTSCELTESMANGLELVTSPMDEEQPDLPLKLQAG